MKNPFKGKISEIKSNFEANRVREIINKVENRKEHNIFILQIKTIIKWLLSFFKKKKIINKSKNYNYKLNGELDIVGKVRNELENTISRLTILKHELEYGLTEEQRRKINNNHNITLNRFKELIDYQPSSYNNIN